MPNRERLQEFVAVTSHGKLIEAVEEFYAENAVVQTNGKPPVVGRDALLADGRQILASVAQLHEFRAASLAVDGEYAAINWVIDYTDTQGKRLRLDEIAYQTWQGDKIIHERFYYDPATVPV